ncbi:MAG: phosphatidylglycerophosphatase A, partial [Candidatus Eisenbacteria bacterium]
MKGLLRALATMGPVGYAPVAPATAGSAVVVLVGWFLPVAPLALTLALLVVGTLLAVWLAGEAEKELGHDAHPIVIDEVIGQSLALLFVPHTLVAFAAAFVLFRVFDVWKPLGAREIQRLPPAARSTWAGGAPAPRGGCTSVPCRKPCTRRAGSRGRWRRRSSPVYRNGYGGHSSPSSRRGGGAARG